MFSKDDLENAFYVKTMLDNGTYNIEGKALLKTAQASLWLSNSLLPLIQAEVKAAEETPKPVKRKKRSEQVGSAVELDETEEV